MRKIDLTNRRFGRLVALKEMRQRWQCVCDCGRYTLVFGGNLRRGHTRSCGCLEVENRIKHGHSPRSGATLEYKAWEAARQRCGNPNTNAWKDYGGRGIEFRFASFEDFYAHIGPKPTPLHTLDRINNDGHYEPGNIRWATRKEQSNNTRLTNRIAA